MPQLAVADAVIPQPASLEHEVKASCFGKRVYRYTSSRTASELVVYEFTHQRDGGATAEIRPEQFAPFGFPCRRLTT